MHAKAPDAIGLRSTGRVGNTTVGWSCKLSAVKLGALAPLGFLAGKPGVGSMWSCSHCQSGGTEDKPAAAAAALAAHCGVPETKALDYGIEWETGEGL